MTSAGICTGDLRRRVTLQQRSSEAANSYGQASTSWTDVVSTWADIQPMNGRELMSAQAQQSEVTHQVEIRYRTGVLPRMRVVYQSRVFEIQSVIDVGMQHRRLTLMCSEGLTQG